MLTRILIIAAAALGGGALIGRKAVNKEIVKRLPREIETAQAAAIAELDKRISQVLVERLSAFALNLLVKAALIGGPYWLYRQGDLTANGLKIVVFTLIAIFLARDAFKTLPFLAPALRLARANNWNPRRALREFVAAIAFERAYAAAMTAMETGPNRLWLAFSKYSAHSLSTEVANAVAEVARTTSIERAQLRIWLGVASAGAMAIAYSSFVMLTINAQFYS